MAVISYKYAMINNNAVENVALFEDYYTANAITKKVYGDNAFAVEVTEWPVGQGYQYIDGRFYEPDGKTLVPMCPTADKKAAMLERELIDTKLALVEQYEENIALGEQITNLELVMCDLYEANMEEG